VNHFSGCDTPEIRNIIAAGNFDAFIVSGWYLKSFWQAIRACRKKGVPIMVRGDSQMHTPRSSLKQWAKEIAYPWILRQFDGFLVVGKRNAEYLEHYGVPATKLFFVPHFVDNKWFAKRAEEARGQRSSLRASWGADDQTFVVLFVGKFRLIKRPNDIVEALGLLGGSGIKAISVFVGSGELRDRLQELGERLNVEVRLEGFKNQTELPPYYAAADVLVLPSESETWGLVVNEAMACGVPAIVSDAVGCGPDLIEEGSTGYTFPVGNTDALASRLTEMISTWKTGFRPLEALRRIVAKYSIDSAVRGTLQCLETVTKHTRGSR
jgi:glycosyltransferase involved in cell wall biosynthesis